MKLTIDAMCLLSAITDKMELDDDFIQELIKMGSLSEGKNKNKKEDKEFLDRLQKQIGAKVVLKITSKLHLAKDELIEFISTYKEVSKEEAKKINIIDVFKELIEDKDIQVFFKQKFMPT